MGKNANAGALWSRAANVACVDRGSHVALLSLALTPAGPPRILEGPAASIWRELSAAPRSDSEIIAEIAEAFGEPPAAIEDEVRAFLHDLQAQGLAQESN